MTEILFYHLQGQKLEGVLPTPLEKSLARGWKAIVQGARGSHILGWRNGAPNVKFRS